jgi:hypothetical protein
MNFIKYSIICFSIIFTGCIILPIDKITRSSFIIKNESSYNLEIKIVYKYFPEDIIYLQKEESKEFIMNRVGGRSVTPPDPNDVIIKFIFTDLDTDDFIKEIDNNNFFKLTNYNYSRQNIHNYEFIITDVLLFMNKIGEWQTCT